MNNDFPFEVEVNYKYEKYIARNDGSVYRHKRQGKRARPYDCNWLFGNESESHPYLTIGNVRIHQIIATAFHGNSPGPEYVVDHIDTNCRNNRPENLRWVTRLENALLNPITRKKIEFRCGSVESFLSNPAQLNNFSDDVNFKWMRKVSIKEAQNCKERMNDWISSDSKERAIKKSGKIDEWIFKPVKNLPFRIEDSVLTKSITPFCLQKNWRVPSYFPCCPDVINEKALENYFHKLNLGEVFSCNHKYPEAFIVDKSFNQTKDSILVLCEIDGVKPWVVAKIEYNGEYFIHISLGSFFTKEGADKQFVLEQGKLWFGENSIDDYC